MGTNTTRLLDLKERFFFYNFLKLIHRILLGYYWVCFPAKLDKPHHSQL